MFFINGGLNNPISNKDYVKNHYKNIISFLKIRLKVFRYISNNAIQFGEIFFGLLLNLYMRETTKTKKKFISNNFKEYEFSYQKAEE